MAVIPENSAITDRIVGPTALMMHNASVPEIQVANFVNDTYEKMLVTGSALVGAAACFLVGFGIASNPVGWTFVAAAFIAYLVATINFAVIYSERMTTCQKVRLWGLGLLAMTVGAPFLLLYAFYQALRVLKNCSTCCNRRVEPAPPQNVQMGVP